MNIKDLSDRELINKILSGNVIASNSLVEEVALRFKEILEENPSKEERAIEVLFNVFDRKEREDKKRNKIMISAAGDGAKMHEALKYLTSTEICVAYKSNGPGVQVRRIELSKAIDLDDEDIKYFRNKYK